MIEHPSINTPQLSVFNTNNGSSNPLYAYNNRNTFVVYGDGRVYIGQQIPFSTGVHSDAMLSVDGKVIAKKFYVTTKPGVWGDDEFDKDITLDSLREEVQFALKNKRLSSIKSAKEVETEGIEINETIALLVRKIERLYLYVNLLYEENNKLKMQLNQQKSKYVQVK